MLFDDLTERRPSRVDGDTGTLPGVVARMRGCPQTPEFHGEGDVAAHTDLVVDQMEQHITTLDTAAAGGERDWAPGLDISRAILRAAALLHDVGKPDTTVEVAPCRWAAPGHADVGARIVARLFAQRGPLRDLGAGAAAAVHTLVRSHMWVWAPERISRGAMLRAAHLADPAWLRALWAADAAGRICDDANQLHERVQWAAALCDDAGASQPDPWPHLDQICDIDELDPQIRRTVFRNIVEGHITTDGAARAAVHAAARNRKPGSLTYLIGVPGSGKTSWADRWQQQTDGITLTADAPRRRDRKAAHGQLRHDLEQHLRDGAHVLVDATHVTRESRDRMLTEAAGRGVDVHAVIFNTPLDTCHARQSSRPWREAVPADVVDEMAAALRWPTPDEYGTLTVVEADGTSWQWDQRTRWEAH